MKYVRAKDAIQEALSEKVILEQKDFDKLIKDRLDFGFDNIYFRYAATIDELGELKERYERDSFNRKIWANSQKQHFYITLEQLLQAHQEEK